MYKRLAKIVETYSKAVREWSTTSQKQVIESKEFGTNKQAWLNSIRTTEKLADRNDEIAVGIQQKVVDQMVSYKNENYGKSFIHVRKIKDFDKEFKKVQKSWLELLNNINDAKQSFHDARRKLHQAVGEADITRTDVGSSDDEKKKAQKTVERRRKQTNDCRTKYQSLIEDMQPKQQAYQKDMFEILKRTDEFERKRLNHFKTIINALKEATSIENDKHHPAMLEAFNKAIDEHKTEVDIDYFNKNYGCETTTKWPVFEDLTE